jgi:hypothetical protein
MQKPEDTLSFGITSLMSIGVALLPWMTWVIAEIVLFFYRRAVQRSMRAAVASSAMASTPPAPPAPSPLAEPRDVELQILTADDTPAASGGNPLHGRVRRAPRDAMKIYAAAGLTYASVLAFAFGLRFQVLEPRHLVTFGIAFAWPLILTALYIVSPRRRWQAGLVISYWTVFFISVSYAGMTTETVMPFIVSNIGGTIAAIVVRVRRIRAVAPLIGAFLTLLGVPAIFALGVVVSLADWEASSGGLGLALSLLVLLALVVLVLAGGPYGGWLTLRWLGRWYAEKRTSDQTITMAAIWLIFAGVHGATIAYDDMRWMSIGLLAFAMFLAGITAGFRVLRRRSDRSPGPRLLVLRVFALGRRSRRLFDRLTSRWRHIGSVQLIAGPDLASSTVEPHEFFDFLRRRLSSRFLDSHQSIESALTDLDVAPDHDGRYRITDFFCRDTSWRTVFRRLAEGADVVLMDLRGFSSENCGCTYELGELLNLVPIDRIAIVIDHHTDERFLDQTIEQASARISPSSPNTGVPSIRLQVFRETGWRGLDPDRLLHLLCDTVAQPKSARVAQEG